MKHKALQKPALRPAAVAVSPCPDDRAVAMRIQELSAFHVRIPLRKTIRHASHTRTENDTLIVRCRLQGGIEGWGEGLPRHYVTGETIESAFEQLRGTDFRSQLGGTIEGVPEAVERMQALDLAGEGPRDCFGNSVRCALEIAVLDAACRAHDMPLSAVTELFPETAPIRDAKERVRYSAAFTAMSGWREVVRALKTRYYQFHQSKVKVGVAGADDAASLRRIRRILGPDVDLRIDANEAWTCENLEARLAPLLPYQITSVEQPVPHAEVDGLAAVRPRLTVPLMLDESLCSLGDARRAIELGTCDLFNIRLSKCGGFVNSLRLAALAHEAGLGYQLGCQVGETGILSAAGRHFATSVANIRYIEGSFDHFLVREPLTVEDITFRRGGYAPALAGPGLGVTVDPSAVARVTLVEEHWRIE